LRGGDLLGHRCHDRQHDGNALCPFGRLVCHPRLWAAVANRIQRAGGPPVSGSSILRIQVQELTPGLVDAVAVIRRDQRAVFIALRLEAMPGRWELIELLYLGVSDGSWEPQDQADDHDRGTVVGRPLVEAGGDAAPLLEPVHTPLHHVALPIARRVNAWWATRVAMVWAMPRRRNSRRQVV
jgi:Family of unknown function (DUF6459)